MKIVQIGCFSLADGYLTNMVPSIDQRLVSMKRSKMSKNVFLGCNIKK